jgi:hypothetical protein
MGEVVRFVAKAERERTRLVQQARAAYDSIFPPSDTAGQPDATPEADVLTGASALLGEETRS